MNRLLQHFVADTSPTKSSGAPSSPPPPGPPRSIEAPKHSDPNTQSYLDKLDEIPLSSSNGNSYDEVDLKNNTSSTPASSEATAVFTSPPPTEAYSAANETVQLSHQHSYQYQEEEHHPQGQQLQEYPQYYDQEQYYYQQHQDHENIEQQYLSSEDAAPYQDNGAYYEPSNAYYTEGYYDQSHTGPYDQSQYDAQQQSQQYYASNVSEYCHTLDQNSVDGATYFANTSQDQMTSYFSSNDPSDLSQSISDQNDSINPVQNETAFSPDSLFGSSKPLEESVVDNPFVQSNSSNFFASSTHNEEPVQEISQAKESSSHEQLPAAADSLFGSSSSSFGSPAPPTAFSSPPKSPVKSADNPVDSTNDNVLGSLSTAAPPVTPPPTPNSPARSATELFSWPSPKEQSFAPVSPNDQSFATPPGTATVTTEPLPISQKKEISIHAPTMTASPPSAPSTMAKEVHSPKSPKTMNLHTPCQSSPKSSPIKKVSVPFAESPKKMFSSTASDSFVTSSSSDFLSQINEIIKSIRSESSAATYENSTIKDEAWEVAEMYKKMSERLQKEKDELLKILAEQADQFYVMQDYISQLQGQIAALALVSPSSSKQQQPVENHQQ